VPIAPECFLGASPDERRLAFYEVLGGTDCFLGLSPAEQEQKIYEALGGTGCFLGLSPEERQYALYVAAGGEDACFRGSSPEMQQALFYEALSGEDLACFFGLSPEEKALAFFENARNAPNLLSAIIPDVGDEIHLLFDEVVSFGAGGNAGFVATLTGGASAMTYVSGEGTATLIYSLARTVEGVETGTLAYTQPGDGVEDDDLNDLASFSGFSITNNSEQGVLFFTYLRPDGVSVFKRPDTTSDYERP